LQTPTQGKMQNPLPIAIFSESRTVAGGVPKDHIVLAFHPPYLRQHTGYAVA